MSVVDGLLADSVRMVRFQVVARSRRNLLVNVFGLAVIFTDTVALDVVMADRACVP